MDKRLLIAACTGLVAALAFLPTADASCPIPYPSGGVASDPQHCQSRCIYIDHCATPPANVPAVLAYTTCKYTSYASQATPIVQWPGQEVNYVLTGSC